MQSGLASGSSEIVMCINVVAHREAKLPHGEDNSPKRPTGGMAASRGGQLPNGPQGAKMHYWEDTHQLPTEDKNACNGGAKTCEKCITGRTPIDSPQGSRMPVMEEQKHVKIASLGRHPSTAHRGQECL